MLEVILPNMTCGHCVRSVTETVRRVDPAARLSIDLPTHRVTIDSGAGADRFIEALSEEGYPPAPVSVPSPRS